MKRRTWLMVGLIVLLAACGNSSNESTESYTYRKVELPLGDKVTLGKSSTHEIVFIFDYSCPWCKKWMATVLPEIESRWLKTEEAMYKGQPLVLLNEQSQLLANVDYNVERIAPHLYYDVQRQIGSDAGVIEDFGTEDYVRRLAERFTLDPEQLLRTTGIDAGIQNARHYTRDLGVEYVPTVYVDGIKLLDPFSLEEIEHVMTGKIRDGDQIDVVKTSE